MPITRGQAELNSEESQATATGNQTESSTDRITIVQKQLETSPKVALHLDSQTQTILESTIIQSSNQHNKSNTTACVSQSSNQHGKSDATSVGSFSNTQNISDSTASVGQPSNQNSKSTDNPASVQETPAVIDLTSEYVYAAMFETQSFEVLSDIDEGEDVSTPSVGIEPQPSAEEILRYSTAKINLDEISKFNVSRSNQRT